MLPNIRYFKIRSSLQVLEAQQVRKLFGLESEQHAANHYGMYKLALRVEALIIWSYKPKG